MILEERMQRLEQLNEKIGELIIKHDADLVEIRQENAMTRRIWIAIAKKQQLFDDNELRDVFGESP